MIVNNQKLLCLLTNIGMAYKMWESNVFNTGRDRPYTKYIDNRRQATRFLLCVTGQTGDEDRLADYPITLKKL